MKYAYAKQLYTLFLGVYWGWRKILLELVILRVFNRMVYDNNCGIEPTQNVPQPAENKSHRHQSIMHVLIPGVHTGSRTQAVEHPSESRGFTEGMINVMVPHDSATSNPPHT